MRHTERALQDRLQIGMRIGHRLAAVAAVEVRMHHLPDDRSRPDDRHLDDEVVEVVRLHARQRRHLRAALDLEDADGVGGAQHGVGLRIVWRQVRQIDVRALVLADQRDAFLPAPPSCRGRAGRP